MSTTNNAVNNQTGSSVNNVFHSHIRAASGQWHNYNDQTDAHGYYSGVGSPEGVVAADIGSYYSDTGAGATGLYYKTTDTVNTGWSLLPASVSGSAFLAHLAVLDANVTGAGATYFLGTTTGLTEEFDQGGNFTPGPVAGGAFFTAPSNGIYQFDAALALSGIAAGMTTGNFILNINGGARTYLFASVSPLGVQNASLSYQLSGGLSVQLVAGDIVRLSATISGGGGNTADLNGLAGAIRQCWWSGCQISSSVLSGAFSVVEQTFTANGTYTPTVGMQYCQIECVGGGGAGGGAVASGAGATSVGSGGGAGEYASGVFSAAAIGVSQAVTIGAAGVPVVGGAGGAGGNSSVGALISAFGAPGGLTPASAVNAASVGALGGTGGAGGSVRSAGEPGDYSMGSITIGIQFSGKGASSQLGAGGLATAPVGAGNAALGFGSGGSGGKSAGVSPAVAGGTATAGIVIVTEYVIV